MDFDPTLADRVEFHVNHEAWRVDSNDPNIFLLDRGYTPDPGMHYFTLHLGERQIPTMVDERRKSVGRNASKQWIWETQWTVMSIGQADHASRGPATPYVFTSRGEQICSANLILKALRAYGGAPNSTKFNLFPEYRLITAALSDPLKWHIYREIN